MLNNESYLLYSLVHHSMQLAKQDEQHTGLILLELRYRSGIENGSAV